MNKPSEPPPPPAKATHAFTVEYMQKLAEEMLNDPELGCRSRVVCAFGGDGQNTGPPPEPAQEQPRYDFDYIIMSI